MTKTAREGAGEGACSPRTFPGRRGKPPGARSSPCERARGKTSTNSVPQDNEDDAPPPGKRQRLSKQEKKKRTGANKGRRYVKMRDEVELCWKLANGEACELGEEYVCINV